MESPDKEISTMEIPIKVAPLDELISQIEKSLGENSIWLSS